MTMQEYLDMVARMRQTGMTPGVPRNYMSPLSSRYPAFQNLGSAWQSAQPKPNLGDISTASNPASTRKRGPGRPRLTAEEIQRTASRLGQGTVGKTVKSVIPMLPTFAKVAGPLGVAAEMLRSEPAVASTDTSGPMFDFQTDAAFRSKYGPDNYTGTIGPGPAQVIMSGEEIIRPTDEDTVPYSNTPAITDASFNVAGSPSFDDLLNPILESHSGWLQLPPADFTQDEYNELSEGAYLQAHADAVRQDFVNALATVPKTEQRNFVQHAANRLGTGFGISDEEMAGLFMPEGLVPDEVTATAATVNPTEMGGGLGGHTNIDNLYGYLANEPVTDPTSGYHPGSGYLLAGNFPTGDDDLDKLLQNEADKHGWKDVPTMQDFWGFGMENLNVGPPYTANALPISHTPFQSYSNQSLMEDPSLGQHMTMFQLGQAAQDIYDDQLALGPLQNNPQIATTDAYKADLADIAHRKQELMARIPEAQAHQKYMEENQIDDFQAMRRTGYLPDFEAIAARLEQDRLLSGEDVYIQGEEAKQNAERLLAEVAERQAQSAALPGKIAQQAEYHRLTEQAQVDAMRAQEEAARQAALAKAVYADLMANRDRGHVSDRELSAAMERATQVDTFSEAGGGDPVGWGGWSEGYT